MTRCDRTLVLLAVLASSVAAAPAATSASFAELVQLPREIEGDEPNPQPFSFGTRLGLVFVVQASIISTLSVLLLLSYVLVNALRKIMSPPTEPWRFLSSHVDLYFLNLLMFDMVQAIGGIMDLRWAIAANVFPGSFCTAQGVLKNIGDVGVAFSTLAIAIHTSAVILWDWKAPRKQYISGLVVVAIWLFIILENTIGWHVHRHEDYIGNTGYWCWITSDYPKERIAFEYLWMWAAAFINVLLYIPLFFSLRGNLVVQGWRFRWRSISHPEAWPVPRDPHGSASIARQMLWYPIAYVAVVLPIAIVRWLAFNGTSVSFTWTAIAAICFNLSGLVNVLVYTITRPALLPTRRRRPLPHFRSTDPSQASSGDTPTSPITFAVPRRTITGPEDLNADIDDVIMIGKWENRKMTLESNAVHAIHVHPGRDSAETGREDEVEMSSPPSQSTTIRSQSS